VPVYKPAPGYGYECIISCIYSGLLDHDAVQVGISAGRNYVHLKVWSSVVIQQAIRWIFKVIKTLHLTWTSSHELPVNVQSILIIYFIKVLWHISRRTGMLQSTAHDWQYTNKHCLKNHHSIRVTSQFKLQSWNVPCISGSLPPRHGAFSGWGRRNGLQYGWQLRIYWISNRGQPTRGGTPAWAFGEVLTIPHKFHVTKHSKGPRTWTDLLVRSEVRFGSEDRIELAQERDRWRTLVNAVMNLRVP
jgi:hypothetical protein